MTHQTRGHLRRQLCAAWAVGTGFLFSSSCEGLSSPGVRGWCGGHLSHVCLDGFCLFLSHQLWARWGLLCMEARAEPTLPHRGRCTRATNHWPSTSRSVFAACYDFKCFCWPFCHLAASPCLPPMQRKDRGPTGMLREGVGQGPRGSVWGIVPGLPGGGDIWSGLEG